MRRQFRAWRYAFPFPFTDTSPASVAVWTGVFILQIHFLEPTVAPAIRIFLFDVQQFLVPVVTGAIVRAPGLLHHTVYLLAAANGQTWVYKENVNKGEG